jgi:hypothetical protein
MKKKFDYRQFEIGDWVKVTKSISLVSGGGKRRVIDTSLSGNRIGKISGVKCFRTGSIVNDLGYDEWGHCDGGIYFCADATSIICWEIKTGLLNKPIYAFPEDIKLCSIKEIEGRVLPILEGDFKSVWKGKYGKKVKESLSQDSKFWPRDEKGRWISEPEVQY